jgi:GAF domain-containing protein
MSAALGTFQNTASPEEVKIRLNFFKKLQAVTDKIHATHNVDEIMLDMSQDICELFNCDRLSIYAVGDDKASIVSKVKTGLNSVNQLKLPISEQSIAGYAALSRKILNIKDVYDSRHRPRAS